MDSFGGEMNELVGQLFVCNDFPKEMWLVTKTWGKDLFEIQLTSAIGSHRGKAFVGKRYITFQILATDYSRI
jgi:hypothetical protein